MCWSEKFPLGCKIFWEADGELWYRGYTEF